MALLVALAVAGAVFPLLRWLRPLQALRGVLAKLALGKVDRVLRADSSD